MKPKRPVAPRVTAEAPPRTNPFRFRTGLLILAVAVAIPYAPILAGYVPFPADIVVNFPPWEGSPAKACCAGFQHAELGDLATQFYPLRATLNSALRIGRAPLWDFQVLMGTPYQAMPQSALFFPLNWFFSFFNAPLAWSLLFVVRTVIVALATAIFVRRLGASPFAALISGFIFALSGWMTIQQGRGVADTAMWLPLMFLAVDELRLKASRASVTLGAVAFALPVLGGHPEVAFQVILVAFAYAVYRLFPFRPGGIRYGAAFAIAGLLSILLAAVQLLPTLEWVGLIERSLNMDWGALPPSQFVAFLSRDLFHNPNVDGVSIPEGAAYIGAFTIAVVPFAVLWRKRRDVLFFAALAFSCVDVVYGWQPGYWISRHIPVMAGLPNWRIEVVADFAFAVLAGFAISTVESRCEKPELRRLSATPVAWFLAGAAAGALVVLRIAGITLIAFRFNLLLVLLSLTIVVLAGTRRIPAGDFICTAIVVAAADLITAGFGVVPFVKPADIFPSSPVFEFLRPRANPMWRVSGVDGVYGAQFDLPYGLSSAAGYDFPNRRMAKLLSFFKTEFYFHSEDLLAAPKGTVDLTGTRYFITTDWNPSTKRFAAFPSRFQKTLSDGHVQVFENPDAVPLVSFLPGTAVQVIGDEAAQFAGITSPGFDGKRMVIVPQKIDRFWGKRSPQSASLIAGVTQGNDEVTLSVTAGQDGVVYFNESYYPGWIAEVDGAKAPVIRANYAFMAMPVSQGQHTIRFEFAPTSFRVGAALSGLAVLLIAGILAIPPALRRRVQS